VLASLSRAIRIDTDGAAAASLKTSAPGAVPDDAGDLVLEDAIVDPHVRRGMSLATASDARGLASTNHGGSLAIYACGFQGVRKAVKLYSSAKISGVVNPISSKRRRDTPIPTVKRASTYSSVMPSGRFCCWP